jgi:hypothetical protein
MRRCLRLLLFRRLVSTRLHAFLAEVKVASQTDPVLLKDRAG